VEVRHGLQRSRSERVYCQSGGARQMHEVADGARRMYFLTHLVLCAPAHYNLQGGVTISPLGVYVAASSPSSTKPEWVR
jgi:hypothetical protein